MDLTAVDHLGIDTLGEHVPRPGQDPSAHRWQGLRLVVVLGGIDLGDSLKLLVKRGKA